ncbi:hypothetical protein G6F46_000186 [Rhizopus delemar]|uniref:PQ-loop repeat-containing protein 1 n=2 Tax=Rhizopus TaxID=4842 RepID=A0A9P6Z8C4_9FUNG|nr:hypothetical protein G6F43_008086 [Rhizopus delemar]KAG1544320.1 hypothetical protein G6F51_006132 [Rhizopus arrhizus]KAG1467105.1 hypothetical protein G6F55_000028 [Rhizopus delemar]KAG1498092.1 hypothetical protein G6F54_005321 [Rhizopus delemar]KAG1511813.1 hypothetical protein G6F53_005658 [Rhizopus delemar]
MVVAPTLGYFDQIRIISQKKTSLGFNSATCAILLFSNILRIFFWLGKRFDVTLLFQSIAMLTAMILLLYTVIKYKPIVPFNPLIRQDSNTSSISSLDDDVLSVGQHIEYKWYQRSFWAWDHFLDYVNCLLVYITIISILYILFHQHSEFIEALGFLSLGIESTLPVPQILTNFKHRNTDGFSWLILASWFLGDGFKAFYFFYTQSPLQFVICAIVQLCFDTVVVVQFIIFSSPTLKKSLGIREHYEPIA